MSTFHDMWDAQEAAKAARASNGNGWTPSTGGDAGAAIDGILRHVAAAQVGTRNHVLNWGAYTAAGYVAGGHYDGNLLERQLVEAGLAAGLEEQECRRTVKSGMGDGADIIRHPRLGVPDLPPFNVAADAGDLAAAVHQHLPAVDWHELWAQADDDEEWIAEPLVPARRLVALYSAPKVGKSLLLLELAAAVATGGTMFGQPVTRRRVLYVDFENDPRRDTRERLIDMGYGPDQLADLVLLSFPTLAALDSDKGGRELLAAVAVYRAELVVVDTVSRAVAGEENENDTWLNFYRHTGLRLKQAEVALVRLDHAGKDETRGQRGGSAKSGDVDAVWRLSRIGDSDKYRLVCEATRFPISEPKLTLTRGESPAGYLAHLAAADQASAARQERVDQALDKIRQLDPKPPRTVSVRALAKLLREAGNTPGNTQALGDALRVWKHEIPTFDQETLT